MRPYKKFPFGRLTLLFSLCVLGPLAWMLASKPVLFHSHLLSTADDRSCGEYQDKEPGIPILNPLRPRSPERFADEFLRAASKGECLPGLSEGMCRFVTRERLPASAWRLVDRVDIAKAVYLFYRLESPELERRRRYGCLMAQVKLEQLADTWKISGYGYEPGPMHRK